jgi:thiosulfate reductase cytochrome b subunit
VSPSWRPAGQLIAILLALQVVQTGLFVSRGFPYFGSSLIDGAAIWELPVAAYHLPAIQTLTAMGFCCGFSNGLVLGRKVIGGHIPMHLTGAFILSFTNWLCWTLIALVAQATWIATRGRRAGAPIEDAPTEGPDDR